MAPTYTVPLRRRSRFERWLQVPRVFAAHFAITRRAKMSRWQSAQLAARLTWPLL